MISSMNSDIKLIPVSSSETEALKDYIQELYTFDSKSEAMKNIEEGVRSLMKNEALASPFFIKAGSEKVGYVILTKYHSVEKGGLTVFIDELFVEEKARRHGIGKKVMPAIFEVARSWGAKTLWAQTEHYNEAAQAFFRHEGFVRNRNYNYEKPL